MFDGSPTQVIVDGDEVAAQFSCYGIFPVITHYDSFDEVSVWIYLLDSTLRVIDKITMPPAFGFIENIKVTESGVSFAFMGEDDRWLLNVDPTGRWLFTASEIFRRPIRFVFSKRRLLLSRVSLPSRRSSRC